MYWLTVCIICIYLADAEEIKRIYLVYFRYGTAICLNHLHLQIFALQPCAAVYLPYVAVNASDNFLCEIKNIILKYILP